MSAPAKTTTSVVSDRALANPLRQDQAAHENMRPDDLRDQWYDNVAMITMAVGGILTIAWIGFLVWAIGHLSQTW